MEEELPTDGGEQAHDRAVAYVDVEPSPMRSRSVPGVLLSALLITVGLAACEGSGPKASLDSALSAYDGGRYEDSLRSAELVAKGSTSTRDADEAAYLAGMSAYRLGRYADSVKWLETAARSDDRYIAGQSGVTLGSALLKLNRRSEAARAFAKAAASLDGDEAKKAHLAAANAYREAGDLRMSNEQFRLAGVPVPTGTVGQATAPPPPAPIADGRFILQAGAFRDESKARRRASEVRTNAVRAGLGEPRVVSKRSATGETLWVVQIGDFRDRAGAESAKAKIGIGGIEVGRPT
jgi:tetratricopeptide (TPR) repeat protein